MTAEIRPAVRADWDSIARLVREADLPVADLSEAACDQFAVCVDASGIQGAIALEALGPGQGLLRSLAVSPNFQKRGLGNKLVHYIEDAARSRGISELYLLTTAVANYFAKLGYQPLDREAVPASLQAHEQFRSLCPSSAVVMIKRIS